MKKLFILLLSMALPVCMMAAYAPTVEGAKIEHVVRNMDGNYYYVQFGGKKSDGSLSNEVWVSRFNEYDWEQKNTTGGPSPRYYYQCWKKYDGKLYIYGGIDASGNALNDLWVLDLDNWQWQQITPGGSAIPGLGNGSSTQINNTAYLFGGSNSAGESQSTLYSINLDANPPQVTQLEDAVEPLQGSAAFQKGGELYFVGGYWHDWDNVSPGNQFSFSLSTWKYNPSAKGTWTMASTTGSFEELANMAYITDTANEFLFTFGGNGYDYVGNSVTYSDAIYKLNISTLAWTKLTTVLPVALSGAATYIFGDTIFISGGKTAGGNVSTEAYRFIISTETIEALPLGISPVTADEISFFPNPVIDQLYISIENAEEAEIIIQNLSGQTVFNEKISGKASINTADWARGTYVAQIRTQRGLSVKKLILQ